MSLEEGHRDFVLNEGMYEFLLDVADRAETGQLDQKALVAVLRAKAEEEKPAPSRAMQTAERIKLIREFAAKHTRPLPAHLRRKGLSAGWEQARLVWKPVLDYRDREWNDDRFAGQNPYNDPDDPKHLLWQVFNAAPARRMPGTIKAFRDILENR